MPQVILALPAYNEALAICDLLDAAAVTFQKLGDAYTPRVLVVDDGSSDDTARLVSEYRSFFPVELVQHSQNQGLGPAIITALQAALERSTDDQDVIVNMDADNTHPPDTILSMLAELEAGGDVIIASRYRKGSQQCGVPFFRRMLSLAARATFTFKLRLPGVRDYTCGFRAYHAKTIRHAFETYGDQLITRAGFACTDEILVNLARLEPAPTIAEVPFILRYDRKLGDSKLELMKTIRETLKMLAND